MNRYLLLIFVVATQVGCSDGERSEAAFAQVEGSPVTYGQLELAKERFGIDEAALAGQAESDKRIREMLVASRAMAVLAEKSLGDEEISRLETRVAMYREELLVKKYLEAHAVPEPISAEAVRTYYEKHPGEFGGGKEKEYEILSTVRQLSGKDREKILRQFAKAAENRHWAELAGTLSSLGVSYRRGRARADLLESPLRQLVEKTGVGEISDVHVQNGFIIVRVMDEKTLPPKSLMDVSAQIRKKLAPNKLKEAIKVASEEALEHVRVSYEE